MSLWTAATPNEPWHADSAVTLGVKFRSDLPGIVNGIRFWKGSASDNGTHIGVLYSNTGSVLAQATFTSESGSGWQSVAFSTPVAIAANTPYVAAYFSTSGWSADGSYFIGKGADAPPLHALPYGGADGGNGVYAYGDSPSFPVYSRGANYWVDVLFSPSPAVDAPSGATSLWNTATLNEPWHPDSPVTLGVKFRSDIAGRITGIRFWKGSASDNGTHVGLLYSSTGTLIAQATFSSESGSGWQVVTFPAPVSISPNTTYVAAYFTTSGWSANGSYFIGKGADAPPLHALPYGGADGGNGVYTYGDSPSLPVYSRGANYWVDVVFAP